MTTYDKKRVIAGVLTLIVVVAGVNWHFEFVFPEFAPMIVGLSVLMMGVFALRFAPTPKDFDEHRRQRSASPSNNRWRGP
jgi:hypothetical protein